MLLEKREAFDMATFTRLKSLDDIEEYLDFHAKVLGSGDERTVYDTGLGYVIKFSRKHDEVNQNKTEAHIAVSGAPVPRVFIHAPDYRWLAVEKVRPLKGKQIDAEVSAETGGRLKSLDDLHEVLNAALRESWTADDPAEHQHLEAIHRRLMAQNDWYMGLFNMIHKHELVIDELHEANWGVNAKGTLVLLDPGVGG